MRYGRGFTSLVLPVKKLLSGELGGGLISWSVRRGLPRFGLFSEGGILVSSVLTGWLGIESEITGFAIFGEGLIKMK